MDRPPSKIGLALGVLWLIACFAALSGKLIAPSDQVPIGEWRRTGTDHCVLLLTRSHPVTEPIDADEDGHRQKRDEDDLGVELHVSDDAIPGPEIRSHHLRDRRGNARLGVRIGPWFDRIATPSIMDPEHRGNAASGKVLHG